MELIISTSLIAAFIAGVAALFAPCCITVLLPSYFASIFRERRKVFLMTFIFFLGILAVFLPLGLGISALGQVFSRYHSVIFSLAGALFLVLGVMLVTGRKMSLPWNYHPKLQNHNALSVFVLGIFSGIATTCCAPVLAGVLALSVLPGSVVWGLVYTLAYVLGMVSPLFLIAFLLDKGNVTERMTAKTGPREFKLFGRTFEVTIPELISGITFLVMGVLTSVWAFTGNVNSHSEFQVDVNIYLTRLQDFLNAWIGGVPQYVWAIFFLGVFVWLVWFAVRRFNKEN